MNLDELLNIARAATPGNWSAGYSDKSGPEYVVPESGNAIAKTVWGCSCCEPDVEPQNLSDAAYIATFNPRLIEKMLAEIKAAREALTFTSPYSSIGMHDEDVLAYDKAREALDAELGER